MSVNLNPTREDLSIWGELAYALPHERERIKALPPGQRKAALLNLKRDVEAKRKKQASKWGGR